MTREELIRLQVSCGYRRLPSIPAEKIALDTETMTLEEFKEFISLERKLAELGDKLPASVRPSDPWERREMAMRMLLENRHER